VTDANLVLGRIGTTRLLGEAIRLDAGRAREAVAGLGEQLGIADVRRMAEGILEIAVARMANAIREITIEQGHDPAAFTLVAFGGAGPMHACDVARELGIRDVLVPIFPGNLSALGLLASDQRHELVRTHLRRLSALEPAELDGVLRAHEAAGRAALARDGFPAEAVRFGHRLDMRYARQAFEVAVDLPAGPVHVEGLRKVFLDTYEQRYGHADPQAEIELVNVRTAVIGVTPKPVLPRRPPVPGRLADALAGRRPVVMASAEHDCPVYERERLPGGLAFEGPAVVEEAGSTTVVRPGWRAALDEWGNLRLTAIG
jgi:N-methylhydantoinase A